jgi:hypothetical protein
MAKKLQLADLSRDELEDAVRMYRKRLRQVMFRRDAAHEFLHEMGIFEDYSNWVKMKAKALGL